WSARNFAMMSMIETYTPWGLGRERKAKAERGAPAWMLFRWERLVPRSLFRRRCPASCNGHAHGARSIRPRSPARVRPRLRRLAEKGGGPRLHREGLERTVERHQRHEGGSADPVDAREGRRRDGDEGGLHACSGAGEQARDERWGGVGCRLRERIAS